MCVYIILREVYLDGSINHSWVCLSLIILQCDKLRRRTRIRDKNNRNYPLSQFDVPGLYINLNNGYNSPV